MSGPAGNICIVERAANRDGSTTWIAHGIAGGIPYIAEGDSEPDARVAAAVAVYEAHGRRRRRLREFADQYNAPKRAAFQRTHTMLSLTRYAGEKIMIGDEIIICVRRVQGQKVQIDIHAPRDIPVHREEIYDRIQAERLLPAAQGDQK
jgi:carbon storage regulator